MAEMNILVKPAAGTSGQSFCPELWDAESYCTYSHCNNKLPEISTLILTTLPAVKTVLIKSNCCSVYPDCMQTRGIWVTLYMSIALLPGTCVLIGHNVNWRTEEAVQ